MYFVSPSHAIHTLRPFSLKMFPGGSSFIRCFKCLQLFELVLQFFACTSRPSKLRRRGCQLTRRSTVGSHPSSGQLVGVPQWQLALGFSRLARNVGVLMNPGISECFFCSFTRRKLSGEQFSLSTFADNLYDAFFPHKLARNDTVQL